MARLVKIYKKHAYLSDEEYKELLEYFSESAEVRLYARGLVGRFPLCKRYVCGMCPLGRFKRRKQYKKGCVVALERLCSNWGRVDFSNLHEGCVTLNADGLEQAKRDLKDLRASISENTEACEVDAAAENERLREHEAVVEALDKARKAPTDLAGDK